MKPMPGEPSTRKAEHDLRLPAHRLLHRPWANWLLMAANVAVFQWQAVDPSLMQRYMLTSRQPELAHFLTYAFLHLGIGHLIVNMLMLHLLGGPINQRLGQVGYMAFYLAGGVFAATGFLAVGGDAIVGASGAIGAVMGAYLALLPRANIILRVWRGEIEIPSMYFIVVFFIYNLVMSLVAPTGVRQVAYEAHLAGMVFGFAVGLGLLALSLVPPSGWDLPAMLRQWRGRLPPSAS